MWWVPGLGAGQISIGLDGGRIVVTLEDGAFGPDGPFGGIEPEAEEVQRLRLAIDNYVSRAAAPGF